MTLYVGSKTVSDLYCGAERVEHLFWADAAGDPIEIWRRAMEWQAITESVTLTAPPWAAWVDIVVLGGGGGGSGGNNSSANGQGGNAGKFAHSTFDMIPGRDLRIVIGQGGAGGAGASSPGAGIAGGNTVVATSFNNWSVTGIGGAQIAGTGGRAGQSPGTWSAYRTSFAGGAAQAAAEAAGNLYGGGGGPGKGAAIYGAKAGGAGASGRVWIRWRSY